MLFAAPVIQTIQIMYKDKLNNIMLCYETAASVLGMVSESGFPLVFYHRIDNHINSKYIEGLYVDDLNLEDVIRIRGVLCTNRERTICELIRDERDIQAILESIHAYNRLYGLDRLYSFAKKYGVYDKLKEFEFDALDYYNEG